MLSASFDTPQIEKINENETKMLLLFSSKIKVVSEYIPYTILRLVLIKLQKDAFQKQACNGLQS